MPTGVSHSRTIDGSIDMVDTVVVVTGAAAIDTLAAAGVPPDAIVIAADGALDHARRAGLTPTVLVGDLDSVSKSGRRWADEHATIERHDPDKDHTDTELALARAADLNPRRLLMVSGGGDRIDHAMAAIAALGHPSMTSIPVIEGWWGPQRLAVLHGPGRARVEGLSGATLSLLALHGTCSGVSITGVRWPLDHAGLVAGSGLGISNEITDDLVVVEAASGVVTIVVTPPTTSSPDEETTCNES